MGEKIYYIVEVIIFSSMAAVAFFKPEFITKNILKSDSKSILMGCKLVGIVALLNVIRCLKELFK